MGVRGALVAFAVLSGAMAVLIGVGADDAPGGVADWEVVVSVVMLAVALGVAALAGSGRRAGR